MRGLISAVLGISGLLLSGVEVQAMDPHQAFEILCPHCGTAKTEDEGERYGRFAHHEVLFRGENLLRDKYFDNDEYLALKIKGLAGYSTGKKDYAWVVIRDPDRSVITGWSLTGGTAWNRSNTTLSVSATFGRQTTSGNDVEIVVIDRLGNEIHRERFPKGDGPFWTHDPRHPDDGVPWTEHESVFWRDDPSEILGHLILRVSVPVDGPQPPCGPEEVECRLEWASDRGWTCFCNQSDKNLAVCHPPASSGGPSRK